jgi:hypothetical protein
VASKGWTIQLVSGEDCRKVCRVWFGSDGSYYVTAPYHSARSASVSMITGYYERRKSTTNRDSQVEIGLLEDDQKRLKLSHHPDGFAQFSGEGIVSGRGDDGSPKGIGIMSFTLARPPRTGGSFACAIFGPEDFASGNPSRGDAMNFEVDQIPPVHGRNGFILEGSYFTGAWREYVFKLDGEWYLDMRHNSGVALRYRVLLSDTDSNCFIGLRMFRYDVGVADHSSGFILSGPSGNVRTVDGERMADGIYAVYPSIDADSDLGARLLEYVPEIDEVESSTSSIGSEGSGSAP